MSVFPSTYHSKLFSEFKGINSDAYKKIVAFYNYHETEIQLLDFEERFEIRLAFVDALFELEHYETLLPVCNKAIEAVIIQDIHSNRGENIYQKLLIKKAAAHYHLMEYHKAQYVLKELIKIDPEDKKSIWLLKKCKHFLPPFYVQYTRNVAFFLLVLSALILCVELLFLKNVSWAADWESFIETTRNIIFLSGWAVLIVGDGTYRFLVIRSVNKYRKKIKRGDFKSKKQKVETSSRI